MSNFGVVLLSGALIVLAAAVYFGPYDPERWPLKVARAKAVLRRGWSHSKRGLLTLAWLSASAGILSVLTLALETWLSGRELSIGAFIDDDLFDIFAVIAVGIAGVRLAWFATLHLAVRVISAATALAVILFLANVLGETYERQRREELRQQEAAAREAPIKSRPEACVKEGRGSSRVIGPECLAALAREVEDLDMPFE